MYGGYYPSAASYGGYVPSTTSPNSSFSAPVYGTSTFPSSSASSSSSSPSSSFYGSGSIATPQLKESTDYLAKLGIVDDGNAVKDVDTKAGVETTVHTVHLHGKEVRVVHLKKVPKGEEAAEEEKAKIELEVPRPKKTVDPRHISLDAALDGDDVKAQREARVAVLGDLCNNLFSALDELEMLAAVDGSFSPAVVTDQLSAHFGSHASAGIPEIEDKPIDRFDTLRNLIVRLRSKASTVAPEYVPVFDTVISRLESALTALEGSNNGAAEADIVRVTAVLEAEADDLMSKHTTNATEVVARAKAANESCDLFEADRITEDWSVTMIDRESRVYSEVDAAMSAATAAYEEASECLDSYKAFTSVGAKSEIPVKDIQKSNSDYAAIRSKLVTFDSTQKTTFDVLSAQLGERLDKTRSLQQETAATIVSISDHIRKLTADLASAQNRLWAQQKAEAIILATLAMLTDHFNAEHAKNDAALGRLDDRVRDNNGALSTAKFSDDMNSTAVKQMNAIKAAKEREIIDAMFGLIDERLSLIAHSYFKVALSAIAAGARIYMRQQQLEGVVIKKKRSNAAQDTAAVAECNASFELIGNIITDEDTQRSQLIEQRDKLALLWQALYASVSSMNLNEVHKGQLPRLKKVFETAVAKVKKAQEESDASLKLADVLDAQFLNAHVVVE